MRVRGCQFLADQCLADYAKNIRVAAQPENVRAVTNPVCSELIYLWRVRHSVRQFAADGSAPIASHKLAGE